MPGMYFHRTPVSSFRSACPEALVETCVHTHSRVNVRLFDRSGTWCGRGRWPLLSLAKRAQKT
jgi:hypothetical protein